MVKPTKKQLLVTGGVILLLGGAAAFGILSSKLLQPAPKPAEKQTASGLPQNVDEIQNLRLEGKTDEANKKADTLIAQDSTSKETKYLLYIEKGNAAMGAEQYTDAVAAYQKAAEQIADTNVYDLIGQAYMHMGKKEEAKAAYQKAISLIDKNSPNARSYETDLQQRIDAIDGKFAE